MQPKVAAEENSGPSAWTAAAAFAALTPWSKEPCGDQGTWGIFLHGKHVAQQPLFTVLEMESRNNTSFCRDSLEELTMCIWCLRHVYGE